MFLMRTYILWIGITIATWSLNGGSCEHRPKELDTGYLSEHLNQTFISVPLPVPVSELPLSQNDRKEYFNHSLMERTKPNSTIIQTRISFGLKAEIEHNPYMVSLVYYSEIKMHFCGGTIIGDTWVLTAANCFVNHYQNISHDDLSNDKVNVHSNSANWKRGLYKRHRVRDFHIHKKFHYGHLDYDVAVVKVAPDFTGENEKCVELADSNYHAKAYGNAAVLGWGETFEGTAYAEKLRISTLYIAPDKECKELLDEYNFKLTPRMQCVVGWLTGLCIGDRGGPLIQNKKLIGIASDTSWTRCAKVPVTLALFTKVPRVLDFIHSIIGNEPCSRN